MPARRKSWSPRRSKSRSKGSRSKNLRRVLKRRSSGKARRATVRRSSKRRTYRGDLPAPDRLPPPSKAIPIKRKATLDEYMKHLGKFTFNEPLFMEGMVETDFYDLEVPDYVYGRKEFHRIPKSRFSTYCRTVLEPMINYLMKAQIRWDSKTGHVAVMHGGEYGIREAQMCNSCALLPPSQRGVAGCLRDIIKRTKCTLNDFFNLTAGTEVEGRIPVNENIVESGKYPKKRRLTILGHTPMTLGCPGTDQDSDGNKVVHMDTQNNDRSKCSSCIAWNDDGEFIIRFSFPVPVPVPGEVLSFHKPNVFNASGIANKADTMIFYATSNDDFKREKGGMRFAGRSEDGYELFVKVNVPNTFDPSVNVYELRKGSSATSFPTRLTHATWGDVEGNVTFLNGCRAHLEALIPLYFTTELPIIVCLGDNVGPAKLGQLTDTIDEAHCINWANTKANVFLIGNRDFNKLRLVPEYVFWMHMEIKPDIEEKLDEETAARELFMKKEQFLNTTFPVKPDGKWVHGGGKPGPESIAKLGQTKVQVTL